MSDLQIIESALKTAAARDQLQRAWKGFWAGLLAGGLIWLVVFGLYKFLPLPTRSLMAGGLVAAGVLLFSVIFSIWRRKSLLQAARWIDEKQNLQQRLSSAWEAVAKPDSEWKQLLVADAARHARNMNVRGLMPLRLPRVSRWALTILALGIGLGFVPTYRTKAYVKKQQDVSHMRETGKELAQFTRKQLEQRPPVFEPTQKSIEAVAELGDKLGKASLTPAEALRDLASAAQRLEQQAKELGQKPELRALAARERESGSGGSQTPEALQKQIDAMQSALGKAAANSDKLDKMRDQLNQAQKALNGLGDKDSAAAEAARQKLAQSLSELSKQMKDMGQNLQGLEEAIEALQKNQTDLAMAGLQTALQDLEKLRDQAKALQQLQQQAAKIGKDLPEQLKQGQAKAAQSSLEKMIEQLKSANVSKEALQKILDEVNRSVEPGSQYGKVGDHLKNAVAEMKQGKKGDAAQSLADAAKELEKLQQEMADAQALLAALESLDRAQMAMLTGKEWSECQGGGCKACNGMGCALCKGRGWGHGGKPGTGVGTWAGEQDGWTFWEQTGAVDNSGVTRPDMAGRGLTDRPDDLNPNLTPTKIRGQMSPGGPMPSITLKGVSIRGQSTVQFQEAAAAAQSEAQSALNQDQVPRAYQNSVRDYFDDLKK
jgi:DNA repair exonuclease SbcCD ATPase subunit